MVTEPDLLCRPPVATRAPRRAEVLLSHHLTTLIRLLEFNTHPSPPLPAGLTHNRRGQLGITDHTLHGQDPSSGEPSANRRPQPETHHSARSPHQPRTGLFSKITGRQGLLPDKGALALRHSGKAPSFTILLILEAMLCLLQECGVLTKCPLTGL